MKAPTFVQFCTSVCKVRLEPAQRVWAKVAIDGAEPLDLVGWERDCARSLFGDVDVVPVSARDVDVLVKGARIGGTYLGSLYLLWRALVAQLQRLAAGELAVCLVVAPDLRLARQALRYALGAAKKIRGIVIDSETSDGFVIVREDGRRVSIECLPATRGGSAVRGRTLLGVLLSEAALFRSDDYIVNDRDVFAAASPRVVDGGLVIIESTPQAEIGLLWELFRDNHGNPTTCLAAHAPTLLVRTDPKVIREVERERERDPENCQREFDAIFESAGSGLFFDAAAVAGAVVANMLAPLARIPRAHHIAVVDAGYRRDAASCVIVAVEATKITVVAGVERKPTGGPLVPREVIGEFSTLAASYGAADLWTDFFYIESTREHARAAGLGVRELPSGAPGKAAQHLAARALINAGRVAIPGNMRRLVSQLGEITSKPTSGGGLEIRSPRRPGSHGDLASAVVGALWAAHRHAKPSPVSRGSVINGSIDAMSLAPRDPGGVVVGGGAKTLHPGSTIRISDHWIPAHSNTSSDGY